MDDHRPVLMNKLRDAFDECVYEFDIPSMTRILIILIALLNSNGTYQIRKSVLDLFLFSFFNNYLSFVERPYLSYKHSYMSYLYLEKYKYMTIKQFLLLNSKIFIIFNYLYFQYFSR